MENEIFGALRESGFTFKKRFGQNFITDRNLLASIVRASGVTCEDSVVEIGCGAGTLTREIAAVAKRVVAFELDGRLAPVLEKTLADFPNTQVVFSDFLKIDLGKLEEELGEYSVIANIPYYVTTPLITKLIEEGKKVKSITVMVQEEVEGADICFIFTEWDEIRNLPPSVFREKMQIPLVYDGRNLYNVAAMKEAGIEYYSIGR